MDKNKIEKVKALDKEIDELREEWNQKLKERNELLAGNDWKDKYIAIGKDSDKTYIHVASTIVSKEPDTPFVRYNITFQGHGFSSEFHPEYTDSNWCSWSWWVDMRIRVEDMEKKVKIITKEEFTQEFRKMWDTVLKQFEKYEKE